MSQPAESQGLLSSVQRALHVLEVVASAGDGVTAKAVARRCGFKLSTTYHLLNTLIHEGYLVRLPNSRGYGLGYKLTSLNQRLRDQLGSTPLVSEALQHAHRISGTAVYYSVLRDAHLVVAEVVDSPETPRVQPLDVGFHEAAHATAFGKVLLAHLPARRTYLAEFGLRRLTDSTITRLEDFEEELDRVRATGVAQEVEEFRPDLACVAVPVLDASASVVGAVAASAPLDYFRAHRDLMIEGVRESARLLGPYG
ncbi:MULTISPECIES: IclR family transcriptional regulator [unclassified Streptosporangium]|uniref:IclR family transcriptional regulator n=1 Tax=Streptosporangium sp. NPDC002544 TaxID=3154538 RepID=UPI0033245FE0